ncbi:RING-H2 finger protein [Musa troglodytarum]|uniref:RING-H2 finger protein n=1 Tax=Musa troglodytarum TaxID=320322 RepID=A0A9E7GYB8_9LILI|nr:RING-H2 finger protein [Musa troglodytarum]
MTLEERARSDPTAIGEASIRIRIRIRVVETKGHQFLATRTAKMGAADAQIENLFGSKKPVKNPLVPIGALMTAGVLTAGLVSFRQGNSQLGQKLMRARVVFQGATVALMVGSAYYYGETFRGSKNKN